MITVDDFTGIVPNLAIEATRDKLQRLIDKHEKPFMHKLLGLYLAKDVEENPQDYTDLINGDEWLDFHGIKEIVIKYVYWFWLKQSFLEVSPNGVTVPKHENSESVSPYLVLSEEWNSLREKHLIFLDWQITTLTVVCKMYGGILSLENTSKAPI